jgi:4-hydroxy-tetrahydrodipicolinate reductase
MPLKLLINGSRGRMGLAVAEVAAEAGFRIVAAVDQGDDLAKGIAACDVIIDFSSHDATRGLLKLAVAAGRPVVIGTTGHAPKERQSLRRLASKVPCVWSGNYSVGVNLLYALTRTAARTLGGDFDAELIELHHRFKKDAPSGTAERLLEVLLEERRLGAKELRHGRAGITGARTPSEIGVHSVRGGDIVGDHTVIFAALGERLELTHRASDRAIFAKGALRAAAWVVRRRPGVYDMQDVLGLR